MKLKSLKLENFRQHEDSFIEFQDGITIISGSNGAGKSTLLEAITWAMYGTDATRGNKDTIKFNKAQPRTKVKVEFVFELDGDVFRIIRYLDKAEVYLGNNEAPAVTSQQEVTKYLTDKIGMTKNEFFNTYFTGQKELNFLKNQGPTERRKFISRVLNYDRMREVQERARVDKNNVEKEIIGLKQGLDDVDSLKKERKQVKQNLAEIKVALDYKQNEFNKTSDDLKKIEPEWEKIKETKEKFDKLTSQSSFLAEKNDYLQKNIEKLTNQIKNLEEKNRELSDLMPFEAEYKTLEQKIKEQELLQEKDSLRQKYAIRLEGLEKEIKEKQNHLDEIIKSGKEKKSEIERIPTVSEGINILNQKIQQIESDLSSARREKEVLIQQKQKEIEKIEKQLDLISEKGVDGTCPTCERPLKDEFDKVIGSFKDQINVLSVEINGFKKELESLSKEPYEGKDLAKQKQDKEKEYKELLFVQGYIEEERRRYKNTKEELDSKQQEVEKLGKSLVEIPKGFELEELKRLREQMTPLKEKYEKIISLKTEIFDFNRLKNDFNEAANNQNIAKKELTLADNELKKTNYSEEKYKKIEKNHHETKEIFYKLREEIVKIEADENGITKEIERIKKIEGSNKEKTQLIEAKQEEANLLAELDRFYGQLWEKLNNEARPEISDLAGKFLSDLTDNRYSMLELNDKYEVCLHDDGEIKYVISGGEEDIVNLCIRLAISQIIAQRSGKTMSLLILDEIFGSLDENRRSNVISLLKNLTNNFEQIILITHIDDIKNEIDNIINIEFDAESGSSSIVTQNASYIIEEFV